MVGLRAAAHNLMWLGGCRWFDRRRNRWGLCDNRRRDGRRGMRRDRSRRGDRLGCRNRRGRSRRCDGGRSRRGRSGSWRADRRRLGSGLGHDRFGNRSKGGFDRRGGGHWHVDNHWSEHSLRDGRRRFGRRRPSSGFLGRGLLDRLCRLGLLGLLVAHQALALGAPTDAVGLSLLNA
jgi:hypothetical protein